MGMSELEVEASLSEGTMLEKSTSPYLKYVRSSKKSDICKIDYLNLVKWM